FVSIANYLCFSIPTADVIFLLFSDNEFARVMPAFFRETSKIRKIPAKLDTQDFQPLFALNCLIYKVLPSALSSSSFR
ncbi:MAG: hypothetical protein KBT46_08835, partial [Ruminococcus sp.]|nr:hypothetical protein [Candidatus Copronaster equi]